MDTKIEMDLPDEAENMEESSDIIAVRPRQTDSIINSPQPSSLSLQMLDVSNFSPLEDPLSPVHGQGSDETITELSNTDSIRGNSDPTGRGLLMLHERPQSASFTRRSETQDQLMPLGCSESNMQWPLTPRDNVRTMSERPNSHGSCSQSGTFKRSPSVRIAVMGKVQEPGEWEGSGPSSFDRESKTSGSKFIKRSSRPARVSGSSGSPSGSSRLTGTGSVRGSISISSKSRSDLADLAHI
jgi:hypothetical protein